MSTDYKIKYSEGFEKLLASVQGTLAISVYQAGKILLFDADERGMRLRPISYQKPMGICSEGDEMAIATLDELHVYKNEPELSDRLSKQNKVYDHLYFPRKTFHCGALDLHDIALVDGEWVGVNTLFSCICKFDNHHNFVPIWQPDFISELTPEDRCHLNGMAIENGEMKYITALGHGDYKQSWRADITNSGILIDIKKNEIVLDGLAMPHSPRLHNGKLFLLESAKGELIEVDLENYTKRTVAKLNGLVRGLVISNGLAFIGISMVREGSSTFKKLTDDVKADNASIQVIDLKSGMVLGSLNFGGAIREIYDVQLLRNKQNVGIFGLYDARHKNGISIPGRVFWRNPIEKKPGEEASN